MMIPKLFHQIWLGEKPLPIAFQVYQKTWIDFHPDWKIILWTEADISRLMNFNSEDYQLCQNYSEKSDYLRFSIIFEFGGVYIDTDFECLKNIEPLLIDIKCFFGQDIINGKSNICGGIFGAEKENPIIASLFNNLNNRLNIYRDSPSNIKIGPAYIQEMLEKDTNSGNCTLLDPHVFFGYSFDDFKLNRRYQSCVKENTYGVHHFAGSWWSSQYRMRFIFKAYIRKFFEFVTITLQFILGKQKK